MMKQQNDSKMTTEEWQGTINSMMKNEFLNAESFKKYTEQEQAELKQQLSYRLEKLDNEFTRVSFIMGEVLQLSSNRMEWEHNHLKITRAIQSALKQTGVMPGATFIAGITGLSRQTVTKHLSEEDNSVFTEHINNFSFMAPHVLSKVLFDAIGPHRTVSSMKLYFELLEKIQGKSQSPLLNQNNYIQINNTVLKQETLQQLNPEILKQIEDIIQKNMVLTENKE